MQRMSAFKIRPFALLTWCLLLPTLSAATEIPLHADRGPRDFELIAGGDVSHPRGRWNNLLERQNTDLFAEVSAYAQAADLAFVNLESPYTDAEYFLDKRYPFATPPARINYVLQSGFNLFSLANNHMFDCGPQGVDDTLGIFERQRERLARGGPRNPGEREAVFWAGASRSARSAYEPMIFQIPGKEIKVAFHAFGYARSNLVPVPSARGVRAVREHAEQVDFTIVSLHYGKEYQHVPEARHTRIYRRMIDAGADIVIGHHPHVIQGIEPYKEGIIFYSLGNFSMASKTVRHRATGARLYGLMPRVYVRDGRVEGAELVPLYVNNMEHFNVGDQRLRYTNFRPQVLSGVFAQKVLTDLREWTHAIPGISQRGTDAYQIRGDRAWVQVRQPTETP